MVPAEETEPTGRTLRRVGPLVVILVVVAGVVAARVLSGNDKTSSSTSSPGSRLSTPGGSGSVGATSRGSRPTPAHARASAARSRMPGSFRR